MESSQPRPWQFSLRSLLLMTVFIAVVLGAIGRGFHEWRLRKQQAERQRLAAERLRVAMVARKNWERLVFTHETEAGVEAFADPRAVDGTLSERLSGISGLKGVRVSGPLTDDQLAHLSGIQQLESLDLNRAPVTGKGVIHLKSVPNLKSVTLRGTGIDDAALVTLGQISTLEAVKLYQVPIRGSGLGHLKGLTKVRRLSLISQSLDEVQNLEDLDQLETLKLIGPGLALRHVEQISGMENLRQLTIDITFDRETLMAFGELKELVGLQLMVHTTEPIPEPPVLADIRSLSEMLPNTIVTYRTYATGMSWGFFKAGEDFTPPPRANSGLPPQGGYVEIQAFFGANDK